MKKMILVEGQTYILASSLMAERSSRVLKHGETFAVFDRYGDVEALEQGEQGLYHQGTRFLSRLDFTLAHRKPLLLNSTVRSDNALFTVDFTNPDMELEGQLQMGRGTLHITRSKFLWLGCCFERFRISNYTSHRVPVPLHLRANADFTDIFEVRGTSRPQRGHYLEPITDANSLEMAYKGLDDVTRRIRISASPNPYITSASELVFHLDLEPRGHAEIDLCFECLVIPPAQPRTDLKPMLPEIDISARTREAALLGFDRAFEQSTLEGARKLSDYCHMTSSTERFNNWVRRSVADLMMLSSETPYGLYPYAGVPWFSTPFGRDAIITALQTLWLAPSMARGVLHFLAMTQATETSSEQDAQPGKILHEARGGEMAAVGELPFGRYYGSVDSTPLFIMLAGEYYERTADLSFIQSIWENIVLALEWIDRYGDMDGDGFVEYARMQASGLQQQGWKDSHDSVFHKGGLPAHGPIALCEVQGYVYAAKQKAALLADRLGHADMAERLRHQADELSRRFNEAFWQEDIGTFALALDGEKKPCVVRSSNAGHCLYTGIADPRHAKRCADTLMDPASFCGWGIRTIAATEADYNPMSYHNGSVWPHDNSLIAAGFARYGFQDHTMKIFKAMFELSLQVDMQRLPELFCGFERREWQGPVLYPLSCAPQAWAAGAYSLLLKASLGISFNAERKQILMVRPVLPSTLQRIVLHDLRIQDASIDLEFVYRPNDVGVNVLNREGEITVGILK